MRAACDGTHDRTRAARNSTCPTDRKHLLNLECSPLPLSGWHSRELGAEPPAPSLQGRRGSHPRRRGARPSREIALHVHIEGKGHASTLLARLARFGLIENTRTGGRENEWQLTASGEELETAVRHDTRRGK
jgi:hypothetical protein